MDRPQATQPVSLKPSMSRYRRRRQPNATAQPQLSVVVPETSPAAAAPTTTTTTTTIATAAAGGAAQTPPEQGSTSSTSDPAAAKEEQLERARILAETQRRLEGNWWDSRPGSRRSDISEWWEDQRSPPPSTAHHAADDSQNPFRDPPQHTRVQREAQQQQQQQQPASQQPAQPTPFSPTQHRQPQPMAHPPQDVTSPLSGGTNARPPRQPPTQTAAATHSHDTQPTSASHSPVGHAMSPSVQDTRAARYHQEHSATARYPSRSRYRHRAPTATEPQTSWSRRGSETDEQAPGHAAAVARAQTLPTESSSSKHSKLGKLQTLVGLGRGRTVRADARPTATPSQSPHPPSDPVRRETSSPRRPPIAGAGRIQAQASARANAPVSHPSQETRHALLTFEESFTRVPITPATKARQLLTSASTLLSDKINDRNSVLFETCPGLGLERPIRMYEGLRPVVDSWEADSQSAFSIITNPSSDSMVEAEKMAAQSGLEAIDAPRRQPETTTFQLHHCTKSEKWHKRYVTLRSDGKMLIAKKEHGKDSTNVCHMSDFDIYCLRRRQGSHFRPHKKYCYAIKSQQKLSMFLSAEDYMHYFCTNDAQVANDFYAAIHAWRSWYLMQLASEERQSSSGSGESAPVTPSDHGLSPISSPRSATARRNPAIAHQLGSLKPLISQESMDLDGADPGASDLDQRLADSSKLVSRAKTVRKFGTGRMKATAAVYDDVSGAFVTARSRAATAGAASSGLPEQPFISSGLLGKQYEERQREMRAREAASGNEFGGPAVADGPDLMASRTGQSGTMRERGRYRGMREAGPEKRAVSRARSVARGQAPAMRSKSVKAGPRGVTEVDGVAGDQEPFTRGVGAMVRTRTVNHRSQSRGPAVTRNQPLSPTNPFHSPQDMALNAAFDGRMPTLPVSWREPQQTPRNGPLINLNEQSQFAEGSLLRQYESLAAPPHGPIIDRHVPGKTVLVKTGEGF